MTSDSYPSYTLQDPDSQAHLTVVPERGGMITQWQVAGQELLYFDKERFADPNLSVRGGIPILFPICGNLPDNTYTFQGQTFHLNQHGFARDLPWRVEDASANSLSLSLQSSDQTLAVYPFQFQILFTYRLVGSTLEIQQQFTNRSAETMPFTTGLHPYFLAENKQDLGFEIPADQGWDQKNQESIAFSGNFDFDRDEIDWALRPLLAPTATVRDDSRNLQIQISFAKDSIYSLLVFWTLKGKDYYCLEPWSGPRNALNTGDSLTHLPPGATLETGVTFRVDTPVTDS